MENSYDVVLQGFLNSINSKDMPILKPLTGGRSGAGIYKFSLNSKDYVLRMFAEMEEVSGREREYKVTKAVGKYGFAPKTYYVDPNYQGMVIEFLPGRTIVPADIYKKGTLASFSVFLKDLHELQINEEVVADSYIQRGQEWLNKARTKNKTLPRVIEDAVTDFEIISKVIEKLPSNVGLIHNDLISRNIMILPNGFKLVDWPASGYGDIFWDFIDFADFLNLSKEQVKDFFSEYFQRPITQKEWDKFVIMRPIPSIVRAIGGFAFMPDLPTDEKFWSDKWQDRESLISFTTLINDFATDKMNVDNPELILVFLKEANRQISSEEFKSIIKKYNSQE